MKILITGSRGQLGIELSRQLGNLHSGYELIETDIHNLDITNQKDVSELIRYQRPDVVINSAAYTNVDGCERDVETAYRVNAIGPRNLAAASFDIGARIVQVSTDYVFDGTASSPRKETDPVNPINVYGQSKLLGEKLVREHNPRHYILRTAWLYGEGRNFVRTMLRLASERDELNVVDDQIGTPTSSVDLARCIINLIHTDGYGTYHATCEGQCSWYQFALRIFELKGINIKVNPVTSSEFKTPAKRPGYSVLDNFMLKLVDMNTFRHWEDALEEYIKAQAS